MQIPRWRVKYFYPQNPNAFWITVPGMDADDAIVRAYRLAGRDITIEYIGEAS